MKINLFRTLKIISLAAVLSFGLSYAYAWTAPTATPPAGNVSTPLNTSGTAQTKTGDLTVNGSMTASAYYYSSDESLKGNIVSLTGALDKITQLNGYSFSWKKDGRKDIGVIAQEVEKVFPELVSTNKTTGLKSVKYGNMIAPLIESVKELKRISDAQNKEIKELKEEIKILKSYVKN